MSTMTGQPASWMHERGSMEANRQSFETTWMDYRQGLGGNDDFDFN